MGTKSSRKAAETPGSANLAALAKLTIASYETLERDLRARIATLEGQALRFETAIENVSQGICFFDASERLILCNRRYAEIYRIAPEQLQPGLTLREIVERRVAVGTSATDADAYLALARSINSGMAPRVWTANLADGRAIQVCHQPMPDGSWVATHEDITALAANQQIVDERISLQTLIDWVPDYLWVKDTESRFVVANRALAVDSGREKTSDMIGLTDFDLHAPELARKFRAIEEIVLRSGQPMIDKEEFIVDASGAGKWVSSTKVPLRNARDEIIGLVGIAHDVTARKQADILRDGQAHILEMIAMSALLEDVLDRLMRLVESQLTGIFGSVLLLDKDGSHLRHGGAPSLAKDYTTAVDGIAIGPKVGSCGTAVYRREPVIVSDIMQDPLWEDYRHVVAPFGYRSCWSTPILSHQGAVLGVFAMYSMTVREPTEAETRLIDFTTRIAGIAIERKLAEDQIHFMANHDVLTGLPNRALLEDRLSQALLYAQRYERWVTVVFIDLDNFKLVNDTLGHNAGDVLLKTVANRMVECVRSTDTVVRLGGDEFVIVLFDQPTDVDLISETLQKIRSAIAEPVHLGRHRLRATASIGIANYPKDGTGPDQLLANADAAMYRAKEFGRDNFQFYAPEFNTRAHEKFVLQEELRNALARSEFILLYQPQVDLRSGDVFAVEALLRWKHPTRGMVAPNAFIPTAEETGLIVPIGDWVLHEACRQNKAWQDAGLPPLTVCVNVSARQFREPNLIGRVVNALKDSGLEARHLELEVTESLIMQDVELAVATMNALQGLGVQISIDDFGTGYSSLSALKTFPVARLKIDKSFIRDLAADESDQAVASAVISLGQNLHLRVIAEGVETDDQVAFLRKNNCDEMQGYHFSKPVSALGIAKLLGGERGG
ncbi:EAL domain-containing protein [Mesorhizobium sp. M1C.F.Ca.ET.193.01.1.1]|uniref:EAL domain-containing protein n=1 Tax=unclassified Mesorhizobium TaxID=325217 RepID=UPI000FD54BD2|nr:MULTISPECIES: EAL domain-containing protein [unclassified Mesorhizobium]TGS96356.1 EAL domain-containing protein [bacterium M00.F.Ca.ET.177.01.1.1]TGQ52104.1 EAL domain-containing protein [Mesorhizobium sp. M1C.F.Ca.ET.210.01.1.1]TGQ68749.1 EAL domain-containing protein [Mesorhizobium sp. M1C.F.Ca.ET.212.01.1.1]TGR04087.1 EAL domain-containing protein [Mesorhizobium sp. M1C.F.Ca.ET.204.01.1.1]TGR24751.1 EAL domain-containing protein [Mesorhizobium sp. M1C.F.Ca.ET.196.01.1.1]